MKEQEVSNPIRDLAGLSMGVSIIMIILGCLAIVMPNATGIAVSTIFGWVIVLGGSCISHTLSLLPEREVSFGGC